MLSGPIRAVQAATGQPGRYRYATGGLAARHALGDQSLDFGDRRPGQPRAPSPASPHLRADRPGQAPTTSANSPRRGSSHRPPRSPARPKVHGRSSHGSWRAHGRRPRGAGAAGGGQVPQRGRDPTRRLVDGPRHGRRRRSVEPFPPLTSGSGQEALERPAGARNPEFHHSGEYRRRSRNRHDDPTLGGPGRHQDPRPDRSPSASRHR